MTPSPSSPSQLKVASWLIYATKSEQEAARRVKTLIVDIKMDRYQRASGRALVAVAIEAAVARLSSQDRAYWDSDPMLVPVPRSGLNKPNTIWPAHRICEELVKSGLGVDTLPVIERTTAVEKSAGGLNRPEFETQLASLSVRPRLKPPTRLILVDDVVTRGTTMLACAAKLALAYPGIPVSCFALARVQSSGDPIAVFAPVIELVSLLGTHGVRKPAP